MRRFFVQSQDIVDGVAYIRGSDVRHIRDVLRLREGDSIAVLDGSGDEYRCRIMGFAGDAIGCRILEQVRRAGEPSIKITLVQGLPRGDKMDYIVQKGTEVGIWRFVPVITERTVVRLDSGEPGEAGRAGKVEKKIENGKIEKRVARWKRIAMEAAKQAGRAIVPAVERPQGFAGAVEALSSNVGMSGLDMGGSGAGGPGVSRPGMGSLDANAGTTWIAPWELETTRPLKGVLRERPGARDFVVFIGPEGGFTASEMELLMIHGAVPVTLGPRIFRTETAGLVVAAAIFYEYGELGG
ncbi:MAG: 16S rRNA (uracil(1498)-N(3))-methyltransferase [Firmicutes bacterium]|nr:16S rRNA (uracil(1498)-N(3))-methyltransferase [Bacillota bacterium]